MNELIIEALVEKVGTQEKDIQQLKQVFTSQPADFAQAFPQVYTRLDELQKEVRGKAFPEKEMQSLSAGLRAHITRLDQPLRQQVHHHHHVTKMVFIAAGLFLILCLVCMGWYHTAERLDQYKTNDIKYRFLKLSSSGSLQQLLQITDSLYRIDPGMRDSVLVREEALQRKLALQMKMLQMQEEVKQLETKSNKHLK